MTPKRPRRKARVFRGLVWHEDWRQAMRGRVGRLEVTPLCPDYGEWWWVEVRVREVLPPRRRRRT